MNEGKYVFTQVTSLIPRQIFQRLVKKYNGDHRVREFNCSNQLKYMLFGQLTPCKSLRDICLCLSAHQVPEPMRTETITFMKDLGLHLLRLFAQCNHKEGLITLLRNMYSARP